MKTTIRLGAIAALTSVMATSAVAQELCQGYGPQTPRDISQTEGSNPRLFNLAPPASAMNLCLPGLAMAHQLYQAVLAQGHGKAGTQALMLALAKMNQVDWKRS